MEQGFEVFENLQDLKKKAMGELRSRAAGEKKPTRIPSNKLRKIIEEEISFIKNRMHERITQKLTEVRLPPSSKSAPARKFWLS
jgi:hypothetical protein